MPNESPRLPSQQRAPWMQATQAPRLQSLESPAAPAMAGAHAQGQEGKHKLAPALTNRKQPLPPACVLLQAPRAVRHAKSLPKSRSITRSAQVCWRLWFLAALVPPTRHTMPPPLPPVRRLKCEQLATPGHAVARLEGAAASSTGQAQAWRRRSAAWGARKAARR